MSNLRKLSMAVAALLLFACAPEPYEAPERPGQGTDDSGPAPEVTSRQLSLEAAILPVEAETRAAVSHSGEFVWEEEDAIGVRTDQDRWVRFALNSSPGIRKGMFTGRLGLDEKPVSVAVHPFSDGTLLEGTQLTMHLPGQSDGLIPMAAAADGESPLAFKVLTGAISVSVSDIPAEAVAFVLHADAPLTGVFTADISAPDPVLVLKEEGSSSVSVPVVPGVKEFVVPVPAGSYSLSYAFSDGTSDIEDTVEDLGVQSVGPGKMIVLENGVSSYTDIFVTPSGTGRGKGTAWENSMSFDQFYDIFTGQVAADDIAMYGGATFHFAGGTYESSRSLNFDFTHASSAVNMTFLGGYDPASTKADVSRRDASAYPTVFVPGEGSDGRFARFDLRSHLLLDGFRFSGFNKGLSLFYLWTGATNKDIDITLRDCRFEFNKTDVATNGVKYGGVFFVRAGSLTVESCIFDGNEAARGGDISVLGPGKIYVGGTESSKSIFRNAVSETGGSVYIENTTAEIVISNARFEKNTATAPGNTWAAGGAISIMGNNASGEMAVSVTDCDFVENAAPSACAGALGLYNAEQKTLNLTRCTFEGNSCLSRGGAIYTDSGANGADIYRWKDCVFKANKVTGTASGQQYGGAVNIQNTFKGTAYVDGCTFEGNTAPGGGGAWSDYNNNMTHRLFFNACRFKGNSAGTGAYGNAVYHCSGYAAFHNCAFWDNMAEGQKTPRDIMSGSTSEGAVLISQTTVHQSGGDAPVYINGGNIRLNVVNSVLATAGYPTSLSTGSYKAGSDGDHVVEIGSSNAFYTGLCTGSVLLGYDAWKDKFDAYKFSGDLGGTGFTPMTQSSSAYIKGIDDERSRAFDAWLTGLGAYSRDIDGSLRSAVWTPGCVQTASESLRNALYL